MRRSLRQFTILATLAAAFLTLPLAGAAQDAPAEAIEIDIVGVDDTAFPTIEVIVTADHLGRPLAALEPSQLAATENDLPATVTSVQAVADAETPLALVLVIDTSGSMAAGGTLDRAKQAAATMIGSLGAADVAAVVSFADQVVVEQALSSDTAALTAAVNGLQPAGNTALYQAVSVGANIATESGFQRRAVVLLSDGEDFGDRSTVSREESVAAAADGALFYVVGVGPAVDRDYLQQVAVSSGGRLLEAVGPADVAGVYASLSELLRSQLLVTLESTALAEMLDRSLALTVNADAATGTATRTYTSLREPAPAAPPVQAAPDTQPAAPDPPAPAIEPEPEPEGGSSSTTGIILGIILAVVLAGGAGGLLFLSWRRRPYKPDVPEGAFEPPRPLVPPSQVDTTPRPRGSLSFQNGSGPRSLALDGSPVTIGSGDQCALRLEGDAEIASLHARLWFRDGRPMLHHLGGDLPTLVRGRPVQWTSLEDGDEITVGHVSIAYSRDEVVVDAPS